MERNKQFRKKKYPIFPSFSKDIKRRGKLLPYDESSCSSDDLMGRRSDRRSSRRSSRRRNSESSSSDEDSTTCCRRTKTLDCCYERECNPSCDTMKSFYVSGKCDDNINQILKRINKRYCNTCVKIYLDPCITHCLNSSFDLDVNLHIVGDEHHAVGVSYLHQTALDSGSTVFRNMPPQIGTGPYKLDVSGNDITVYSEVGFCNPDFGGVEGRSIRLYQPNSLGGKFTCYKIKRACGNTITLNECPELEGCISSGVGFIIEPNVHIDVGEQNKLLSNSLTVKGLKLVSKCETDNQFFFMGSTLGATRFGNILFNTPIQLSGQLDGYRPTTNLSFLWLQAPRGQVFRYSNLGRDATTVSAHSSNLISYSSQWIGSNVGLNQIQGSLHQNYLSFFYQNKNAVIASGNSVHGASGNVYTCNETGVNLTLTGSIAQVNNPLSSAFNHLNFGRNGTSAEISKHGQINITGGTDTHSDRTLFLNGAADINFGKIMVNKSDADNNVAIYRNPNTSDELPIPYLNGDSTSEVYASIFNQNGDVKPEESTDTTFAFDEIVVNEPSP